MRPVAIPIASAVAAAIITLPAGHALGADAERGRALYELRCGGCHAESVHGRKNRVATDFGEVRRWVSRWNENLNLRWSEEELADVSLYLNGKYYRYESPSRVSRGAPRPQGSLTASMPAFTRAASRRR